MRNFSIQAHTFGLKGPVEVRKECEHLMNYERETLLKAKDGARLASKNINDAPRTMHINIHATTSEDVLVQSHYYLSTKKFYRILQRRN